MQKKAAEFRWNWERGISHPTSWLKFPKQPNPTQVGKWGHLYMGRPKENPFNKAFSAFVYKHSATFLHV